MAYRVPAPDRRSVTRIVQDVGLAEDLVQDALVAALEKWPQSGVPDNPAAWLMATAKHRAIDHFRRNKLRDRKHRRARTRTHSTRLTVHRTSTATPDHPIEDDLLRLVFISCHPVLSTDARVALTLRLLGGLTTTEIARAFLAPEPTIAQRIVRAKRTLTEARVPFELPARPDLAERLSSVLEVIYLIFNEGYAATAGEDWMRPALCEEALRLGRILAELIPNEPEVHGLVALMEIQASRMSARVGPTGEPVLLLDQNRARWDHLLIRRGLADLARAEPLADSPGPYALQAAIAACHARARAAEARLTGRASLVFTCSGQLNPSPVVELNHAVAVSMAFGPQPDSISPTTCSPNPLSPAIIFFPASAEIFSTNSVATPKPAPNSIAPHRSLKTPVNATYSSPAPKLATSEIEVSQSTFRNPSADAKPPDTAHTGALPSPA